MTSRHVFCFSCFSVVVFFVFFFVYFFRLFFEKSTLFLLLFCLPTFFFFSDPFLFTQSIHLIMSYLHTSARIAIRATRPHFFVPTSSAILKCPRTVKLYSTTPPSTPERNVRPIRSKPTIDIREQQKKEQEEQSKASGNRKIKLLLLLGSLAAATTILRKYLQPDSRKFQSRGNMYKLPALSTANTPFFYSSFFFF